MSEPSMSDLLQEKVETITMALPEDRTFDDWYSDGCDLNELAIRDQQHREDLYFAFGYLRGAHEISDVTMSELLDEYEIDTRYQCADCEKSTRPGTPSPHECA